MEFYLNGEKLDNVVIEQEKNALEILNSFRVLLDDKYIIGTIEINGKFYSSDSSELTSINTDSIEKINIEAGTQEEISISLLHEAKSILKNICNDLKSNGYSHTKEFNDLFRWITETLQTINSLSVFKFAETGLLISTLGQIKQYMNSDDKDDAKIESLINIMENLEQYFDSMQLKLSSDFTISKKDLSIALDNSLELLPEIAEAFQIGKDNEALTRVHSIISILESCALYMKQNYQSFTVSTREVIDELYDDMNSLLAEIVGAFENADFVLIGDLLEYELPEKLDKYKETVLVEL